MDKLLYITNSMERQYGGAVINRRNYNLLRDVYGDNLFVYEFEYVHHESRLLKLKNRVQGIYFGIINEYIQDVLKIIEREGIRIVFISNSLFSCFAVEIRKRFPKIVIISFFHNVEYIYAREEYKAKKSVKFWLLACLAYIYERRMVRCVDYVIVLNNRDTGELRRIYHRIADFVLPTSFDDRLRHMEKVKEEKEPRLKLLFVGFNFFANVHGIRWFVEQVMPYVQHAVLYIVGKDMESERAYLEKDDVQVIGTVKSLDEWYQKADVVVSPIFLGSGMKTKTAEALMYAKPILGTKEAFEGYDLEPAKVGALCNTAEDFINEIKEIQQNVDWITLHGKFAREVYETQYSYKISLDRFKIFMSEV